MKRGKILAGLLTVGMAIPAAAQHAKTRTVPFSAESRHPMPDGFRNGVRLGPRSFSASVYVYQGFRGYVQYGTWFPFGCGPVVTDPWTANAMAWGNMYRGPTIGQMRRMQYGWQPGDPYLPDVPEPRNGELMRENEKLRRENEELRIAEAEKRGYEMGRRESVPVERIVERPVEKIVEREKPAEKRVHHFEYSESGYVCPEQFVSTGNHLLNTVFGDYFEETGTRYTAREHRKNGRDITVIRDHGDRIVREIDYRELSDHTPSGAEFVGFVDSVLRSYDISRSDFRDIDWNKWSPRRCGTLY